MNKQTWTAKTMGAWLTANAERKGIVERAILAIHDGQTAAEKATGETREDNGIGWSGADASVATYMVGYITQGRELSGAWRLRGMRLAFKYRKQLAQIANAKAA